ncbi:hypothetical protein ACFVS2_21800 [Brevibacillus sp. NPDC058079]|uniref:hypothetical protein n=1 Tax=Brevibacillus sp. NPDC058079 TaxID=3346330 RepID=UPI0036E04133
MYFISKEEELIGKTIAFTHMAQFADAITIVTSDKGIFVFEQDGCSDDKEIIVYNDTLARRYVLEHTYLRKELHEKGIITEEDISKFEEEKRRESERYLQEQEKRVKEQERQEYERLKALYENE